MQHQIHIGKILNINNIYIIFFNHLVLLTNSSFRSICDRFDVGKATGWRSVKRVVNALINLRNYYIKWPTEEEAMECATFLEEKKGFPGIIGMIDGTHIKIEAPQENHESYINRKGYHSIQLQVVIFILFIT